MLIRYQLRFRNGFEIPRQHPSIHTNTYFEGLSKGLPIR